MECTGLLRSRKIIRDARRAEGLVLLIRQFTLLVMSPPGRPEESAVEGPQGVPPLPGIPPVDGSAFGPDAARRHAGVPTLDLLPPQELTSLDCTLTKKCASKFFRIHSYKIIGLKLPWNHTLTKNTGWGGYPSFQFSTFDCRLVPFPLWLHFGRMRVDI